MHDEIRAAFADEVDKTQEEHGSCFVTRHYWKITKLNIRKVGWKAIKAVEVVTRIVCRTANRAFVGLPVCECAWSSSVQYDTTPNFIRRSESRLLRSKHPIHEERDDWRRLTQLIPGVHEAVSALLSCPTTR
jgi:hypothetical protein